MEDKSIMILGEKDIVPTEELIFTKIGDKRILWEELMNFVKSDYPDALGEWNYYKDGKQWLYKLVWKRKTIFWLCVIEWTFRISFWFPDRAEEVINESNLPLALKEQFKTSKKYGATRALTIVVSHKSDLDNVKILTGIKSNFK